MSGLTYNFEDLALVRKGRVLTGFVSGALSISYDADGDWMIDAIQVSSLVFVTATTVETVWEHLDRNRDSFLWYSIQTVIQRDRGDDIHRQIWDNLEEAYV